MPTLIAPIAARTAAAQRGLVAPSPAQKSPAPEPVEPSKKRIKAAAYRERQQIARDHLWPLLSSVFPEVFRVPAVPLAIGIHHQILEIAGDSIDPRELCAFLQYWTGRGAYRMAVWRGEPRRNLDGSIVGSPTIEQRNIAGRSIWRERYREIPEPAAPCHTPPSTELGHVPHHDLSSVKCDKVIISIAYQLNWGVAPVDQPRKGPMPNQRVPALPAGTDDRTADSITTMINLLTSDPGRADAKPIMTILANLIARYPADARERFLASAPTRLRALIAARAAVLANAITPHAIIE